jgi:hypothetical protein
VGPGGWDGVRDIYGVEDTFVIFGGLGRVFVRGFGRCCTRHDCLIPLWFVSRRWDGFVARLPGNVNFLLANFMTQFRVYACPSRVIYRFLVYVRSLISFTSPPYVIHPRLDGTVDQLTHRPDIDTQSSISIGCKPA